MDKKLKITQIDYAILGLLKEEPRSGYNIRKAFELTALGNFSSSPGTVYPALKRLSKNELIELKKLDKSTKKRYYLTKEGLRILINWLTQPISLDDIKKRDREMLLRFAFMKNLIPQQDVLIFLESYQLHTQKYVQELEEYLKLEKASLPIFGKLAIRHGVFSYKANLDWCKHAIEIIKSVKNIKK